MSLKYKDRGIPERQLKCIDPPCGEVERGPAQRNSNLWSAAWVGTSGKLYWGWCVRRHGYRVFYWGSKHSKFGQDRSRDWNNLTWFLPLPDSSHLCPCFLESLARYSGFPALSWVIASADKPDKDWRATEDSLSSLHFKGRAGQLPVGPVDWLCDFVSLFVCELCLLID